MIDLEFDDKMDFQIQKQYGNLIEYELKRAMYLREVANMYEMLFPGYYEMTGKCTVRFLTSIEMQAHERQKCDYKIRGEALNLIDKILEMFGEEILVRWNLIFELNYGRRVIETGMDEERGSANNVIKRMSQRIKEIIESREYDCGNEKVLFKLLEELLNILKMIQFNMILWGCYYSKNDIIYLCLENIEKSAKESGDKASLFAEIAKSILVHEYTHCIHHHFIKQRQRDTKDAYSRIEKEAVLETVAESVQYYYMVQVNQSAGLDSWIMQHSSSGIFPAWGYAGEEIVRIFCERNNRSFTAVLKKVIEITKGNWRKAYSFIESMDIVNEI